MHRFVLRRLVAAIENQGSDKSLPIKAATSRRTPNEYMILDGLNILVVGMARSGIAAARFASRRGGRVTINDFKPESELSEVQTLRVEGISVVGGGHPVDLFENADLIVTSPGVPLSIEPFSKARAAGVSIIGEIEFAASFIRGKLIGITGSNGKTTVTTLIGELLKDSGIYTQVGGNIGTPLISLVDSSRDDGITVAELSSFQLEAVNELHLNTSIITNITPDHLDRYSSMDDYVVAKANIFCNQTSSDYAVLNADDKRTFELGSKTNAHRIYFSRRQILDEGIFLKGDDIVECRNGEERFLVSRKDTQLKGDHNIENIMAALGAGLACGVSIDSMRNTIGLFKGVEHRLEPVAVISGIEFVNDSKATNVDAAIKALEAFDHGVIVILGGKDKGSDYSPLAQLISERCTNVILIGTAADKIALTLAGTVPLHRASTMQDAVELGFKLGVSGDTVLLAPACASFDMFNSYEHRGKVFKDAVEQWKVESGKWKVRRINDSFNS